MLGNSLSCGIKMLGDRIGRHCLQRDQRNDARLVGSAMAWKISRFIIR